MKFNYDLVTWIDYFIGAFICCYGSFIIGRILLNKKKQKLTIHNSLVLLILSFFTVLNSLIFDNILKIFGIFIVMFIIYKYIFHINTTSSITYSIITYILFVFGDLTLTLLISLLLLFINFNSALDIVKTVLGNILVIIFVYFYSLILKKYIDKVITKIGVSEIANIFILGIITIFILISSMYNLYLNNWRIDYKFIINIVVFVGCLILAIVLFKQYINNKEMTDKYILLNDYLKTSAELIERYSSTIHKNKNNLIAIKGYMKSDVKKAKSYIDNLLDKYDIKKYNWINKINNIQMDAIRYLIYYKLSKAENSNLVINVDVSKELNGYDNNTITTHNSNILLDILGELFDNAIYAGNESKVKCLNLIMYIENENIVIIISNTYKNKVNLSVINKNGYTTKGSGHGFGLYDIDKTIKKNSKFNIKYEIIDNYFVATLTINVK